MKEVFIKYNPYKVETEVTIDGKGVKPNSALNIVDRRLQEWVEDLPQILVTECNMNVFNITFHGTLLDFEDVESVAKVANQNGIHVTCKHIPAKEVQDKEKAIEQVFWDIQHGPFEEFKQPDVINAFNTAFTSEFPVSVIATMGAGKSTLINSLLRHKLMPSKSTTCTAIITEIKDNDSDGFRAFVYDRDGNNIETLPSIDLTKMKELNANLQVSRILIEGDIPFVTSNDDALVLVDTPGPNSARHPEHRAATYRMLSESSKTLVLYVLNETQARVNDDDNLLSYVANSMKVGGKQSKDRFIFVANKLDDFKKDEDSVSAEITEIRNYLEHKGIIDPNIFPASALTALEIRTSLKDIDLDSVNYDEIDEEMFSIIGKIRKFNNNIDLHLETYAPLNPSGNNEISEALMEAMNNRDKKQEALIHTGIVSIEKAIKMYVTKYSKTIKIKNIVDAFARKLESARSFENAKQMIAENEDRKKDILEQIQLIEIKLKNGEEAKEFKKAIDATNYDAEITTIADSVINKAQAEISKKLPSVDQKLSETEALETCQSWAKFSNDLQVKVQIELEKAVFEQLQKNAHSLLDQYKQRIADLAQEVKTGSMLIKPLELMDGDIESIKDLPSLVARLDKKTERIKTGEEWVANTNKKWYKPWTWFQESGHYRDIIKVETYIVGSELAKTFFAPIQKQLYSNSNKAIDYAKNQTKEIKRAFYDRFDELDKVLGEKLEELKNCVSDKETVEKVIKETQERLRWLEDIQTRIQGILDI